MMQTLIAGLDALTLNAAVVKDSLATQLAAAMAEQATPAEEPAAENPA